MKGERLKLSSSFMSRLSDVGGHIVLCLPFLVLGTYCGNNSVYILKGNPLKVYKLTYYDMENHILLTENLVKY